MRDSISSEAQFFEQVDSSRSSSVPASQVLTLPDSALLPEPEPAP